MNYESYRELYASYQKRRNARRIIRIILAAAVYCAVNAWFLPLHPNDSFFEKLFQVWMLKGLVAFFASGALTNVIVNRRLRHLVNTMARMSFGTSVHGMSMTAQIPFGMNDLAPVVLRIHAGVDGHAVFHYTMRLSDGSVIRNSPVQGEPTIFDDGVQAHDYLLRRVNEHHTLYFAANGLGDTA